MPSDWAHPEPEWQRRNNAASWATAAQASIEIAQQPLRQAVMQSQLKEQGLQMVETGIKIQNARWDQDTYLNKDLPEWQKWIEKYPTAEDQIKAPLPLQESSRGQQRAENMRLWQTHSYSLQQLREQEITNRQIVAGRIKFTDGLLKDVTNSDAPDEDKVKKLNELEQYKIPSQANPNVFILSEEGINKAREFLATTAENSRLAKRDIAIEKALASPGIGITSESIDAIKNLKDSKGHYLPEAALALAGGISGFKTSSAEQKSSSQFMRDLTKKGVPKEVFASVMSKMPDGKVTPEARAEFSAYEDKQKHDIRSDRGDERIREMWARKGIPKEIAEQMMDNLEDGHFGNKALAIMGDWVVNNNPDKPTFQTITDVKILNEQLTATIRSLQAYEKPDALKDGNYVELLARQTALKQRIHELSGSSSKTKADANLPAWQKTDVDISSDDSTAADYKLWKAEKTGAPK